MIAKLSEPVLAGREFIQAHRQSLIAGIILIQRPCVNHTVNFLLITLRDISQEHLLKAPSLVLHYPSALQQMPLCSVSTSPTSACAIDKISDGDAIEIFRVS